MKKRIRNRRRDKSIDKKELVRLIKLQAQDPFTISEKHWRRYERL